MRFLYMKRELTRDMPRINFAVPKKLKNWAIRYAVKNDTTLTRILVQHLKDLKENDK